MPANLPRALSRFIEAQSWLDVASDALKDAIQAVYRAGGPVGKTVKNFLHGVWLGHPLHPALTDVPVGAFTTALVFDALETTTGHRSYGRGADAAVAMGLIAATGAAAAGLTDYQHMQKGAPHRVGLVHGVLNVTATGLYVASWIARRRHHRASGMQLGVAGFGFLLLSAYLGGQMVYDHRVGIKRVAGAKEPEKFTAVLPVGELKEGQLKRVEADGLPILLVRRGENVYALAEVCTHLGGPLSEGWLIEDSVVCPWHQSRYQLTDGKPLDGPTTYQQACFETRIRAGQIEVRKARSAAPEPARIKGRAGNGQPAARTTAEGAKA
jgi:nitrite reductase/ring-hydroxylating ferredoxin subunit/uncharacterized membrane protein